MGSKRLTFIASEKLAKTIESKSEELCLNRSEVIRRAIAESLLGDVE